MVLYKFQASIPGKFHATIPGHEDQLVFLDALGLTRISEKDKQGKFVCW